MPDVDDRGWPVRLVDGVRVCAREKCPPEAWWFTAPPFGLDWTRWGGCCSERCRDMHALETELAAMRLVVASESESARSMQERLTRVVEGAKAKDAEIASLRQRVAGLESRLEHHAPIVGAAGFLADTLVAPDDDPTWRRIERATENVRCMRSGLSSLRQALAHAVRATGSWQDPPLDLDGWIGEGKRYATVEDMARDAMRWHDEAQAEAMYAMAKDAELSSLRRVLEAAETIFPRAYKLTSERTVTGRIVGAHDVLRATIDAHRAEYPKERPEGAEEKG